MNSLLRVSALVNLDSNLVGFNGTEYIRLKERFRVRGICEPALSYQTSDQATVVLTVYISFNFPVLFIEAEVYKYF